MTGRLRFPLSRRAFVVSLAGMPFLSMGATSVPSQYACPPCGCASDKLVFEKPGLCPSCSMTLVAKADVGAPYGKAQLPNDAAQVKFPFELLANAIFFPVMVNGNGPYLFALDTGSTNSVVASEVASQLGIKTGAQYNSMGAGSDSNMSAKIDNLELILPQGVTRATQQGATVSMAGLWPLIGQRFYGDIGYDIVQPFVVEIDYARQTVTLHDPARYRYEGHGTTLPIKLYGEYDPQADGTLVVPGQAPIPVRFTIDTGAGGTIVSSPLVDKYRLVNAVGKTVATEDAGVGSAQPSEVMGRLSALQIGPYVVDKPVVALSRDKVGSLSDAGISVNLGGNILRRFTVIIDYTNNTLTLEPNEHFAEPFPYDASGLLLSATGTDFRNFVVVSVVADSPASQAGLQKSDRILAIDGRSLNTSALWQVEDELKKSGSTVTLTIERSGKRIVQPLQLRALI